MRTLLRFCEVPTVVGKCYSMSLPGIAAASQFPSLWQDIEWLSHLRQMLDAQPIPATVRLGSNLQDMCLFLVLPLLSPLLRHSEGRCHGAASEAVVGGTGLTVSKLEVCTAASSRLASVLSLRVASLQFSDFSYAPNSFQRRLQTKAERINPSCCISSLPISHTPHRIRSVSLIPGHWPVRVRQLGSSLAARGLKLMKCYSTSACNKSMYSSSGGTSSPDT